MSLPAITRSSIKSDHALITPDTHVKAPLPGWSKTLCIVHIGPALGARFAQYDALMEKGGVGDPPRADIQRFVYVRSGEVRLTTAAGKSVLKPGAFAYLPPGDAHTLVATKPSVLTVFEKIYIPLDGVAMPQRVIGHESDVKPSPFLGDENAQLAVLLPTELSYDMAINLFSFQPGTTLPFVEIHVMEHGLVLLEGAGVYRLSDSWYPITAGDVIWMAPHCPQWWVASGRTPSRYLYYKDVNRHPLAEML